ncbi:hypothetical protein, partial [Pseudomonas viridiflava]|uniref:hypothetical protein n=1 Tax=Pseudomonas viridiflava TaxID=33069 RepID=UPI0013DEB9EC
EDSWTLEDLPAAPGEVVELSSFEELPTLDLNDEPLTLGDVSTEWNSDSLEHRDLELDAPEAPVFSLEDGGLEELSLDALDDNPADWNEAELAELDLPEVELPVAEPQ